MTDRRRIMCFGDSLTWGWIPVPDGAPSDRYDRGERWTGVLAAELGETVEIIEEGLSGRAVSGDPTDPRLAAAPYLPAALASHLPLDLVIIMLGTNDTKAFMHREPVDIGAAMGMLIGQVKGSAGGIGTRYPAPAVLLVAPPPLGDIPDRWFATTWVGGHEKMIALRDVYAALAAFTKIPFFDAGTVITEVGVDGVHFTAENNRALGTALAAQVRTILD